MTPPIRPEPDGIIEKVKQARLAGVSIEDIAAHLEKLGHSAYANQLRGTQQGNLSGDASQVAHGMAAGLSDQIAAVAATPIQKLSGDKRSLSEIYHSLKDDANIRRTAYAEANPVRSVAGQVAGSVAGGMAASPVDAVMATGGAMMGRGAVRMATNTALKRMGSAAANAGVTGLVAGAANAPPGDMVKDAVTTGLFSAAGGAVASGAGEVVKKGMGLVKNAATKPGTAITVANQPPATPTITQKVSHAISTATNPNVPATIDPAVPAGTRRVLARLEAQGVSVDDLERRVQAGEVPDILSEAIGAKGIRDLRTARSLGNTAPDQIETALTSRAQDEKGRLSQALTKATGTPVDDVEYANERLATARANSLPEYKKFRDMGPLEDERIIAPLTNLNHTITKLKLGTHVMEEVEALAHLDKQPAPTSLFDEKGGLTRLPTAEEADWIKKALDPIIFGSDQAAKTGIQTPQTFQGAKLAMLKQAHREFVQSIDDVTGGQYAKARAEFAGPMQERTAFLNAQKAAPSISATDNPLRILDTQNPDATARGTANYLHNELGKSSTGESGGNVQNPALKILGGSDKRNRLMVAAGGDASKVADVETAGQNITKRMATRTAVMGGSQTFDKMADAEQHFTDPKFIGHVVSKPLQAAGDAVAHVYAGLGRRATGTEMDAMANLLLAGAPGEMTKPDAIAHLRKFEPILQRMWAKQARNSATVGGATARAVMNR